MKETKTEQKNMRFKPEILSELKFLCEKEMRSEQNMIEVLIHQAYEAANSQISGKRMLAVQGIDGILKVDAAQTHP